MARSEAFGRTGRVPRHLVWAKVGTLFVACSGVVESPQDLAGEGAPGRTGGRSSPGFDPGEEPDPSTPAEDLPEACTPEPAFVPIHRLSNREYERAVADLFGVQGDYARRLPSDNKATRFDNNAPAQQLTSAHVEGYLRASEDVLRDVRASPEARNALFACEADGDEACARQILGRIATVAFRRAPTSDELGSLMDPYRTARSLDLDFEEAVSTGVRAVLMSPNFLFRTYGATEEPATGPRPLSGAEYATRLAAFIWGSVPDGELLDQARAGWFDDRDLPETRQRIRQVVRDMLQDPRARSMVGGFFDPYLHLDMMRQSERAPDRDLFVEFDDSLEASMWAETQTFLEMLIARDESPMDILTAEYSWVNPALAEQIYGMPTEALSNGFQRVPLPAERRGILTQATVLTMTSNPNHTSIVNRGLWVMENIMCLPTPSDAPPDAPTETPEIEGASIRERLEAHRSDPSCAVCHDVMDPIGFGLENFDAIGRYRETDDDGFPVDASGELPGGERFSGAVELVEVIERTGNFERCLAKNMLEYAVGRRLATSDLCTLDRITASLAPDAPFSEWIAEIALSEPFSLQAEEESP